VWKIQGVSDHCSRSRLHSPRADGPNRGVAPAQATTSGAVRIPGVHIGHIGGSLGAVEQIRAYWQKRGAVFMHHGLGPREDQGRLDEILERSHIVFHARASADHVFGLRLERYCERRGKPLILLAANSVAALEEALATSLPLASSLPPA
jgi:hypothetical protein